MSMTRHPDWREDNGGAHDDLTVGDIVMWQGSFGVSPPRRAVVTTIEVVAELGDKYGVPVRSVAWNACAGRRVILDLSTGHWCYGEQVTRV